MLIHDDPLIALILRFVVDTEDSGYDAEEFLQRQLRAMRQYLARFPQEERSTRAMEWIGKHAKRYRRDWEKNTVASRTVYLRCADCPLAGLHAADQCEIHEQWLYLLHRYLNREVTTRHYVEDALSVLREYKEQQKVRVGSLQSADEKKRSKKERRKQKKKDKKKRKRKDPQKRDG